MTQNSFMDRLQIALEGESVHSFARRSGISDSTLRRYEKGSMPGLAKLIELSEATGTTIDWLATGRGPMRSYENAKLGSDEPASAELKGFVSVPSFDVAARSKDDLPDIGKFLAFRESWVRGRNISPEYARSLIAKDDSMEPTIRNGDILLIDTSFDRVRDNGIYVVVHDGLVLIKRLHGRIDGSMTLISDNSIYPQEIVPAQDVPTIRVAGRVMWFGRSV